MEEKLIKFIKRDQPSQAMFFLTPVLAIFLTLITGGLIFYILGFKPFEALKFFFIVPIADMYGLSELLLKATPLCLIAIGLSFCFKSNNWNIGAEGQLTFGAIVSGGVALLFYNQEGFYILPIVILAGAIGGMLYASIPAILKTYFNTNEILVSLMLVYVSKLILDYLVVGPWSNPEGFNFPETRQFSDSARLPILIEGLRIHAGIFLALAAVVASWFVFYKTYLGFQMKVSGFSLKTAKYAGYKGKKMIILVFLISGACAGLAGVGEIAGPIGQLHREISPDYGFTAIIVAFLGLESNYGNYMGSDSLIRSLATLAYDKRRSKFFTRELIAVLKLMDKKTIPFDATGSWAGAMGAVQFMPTNVIAYGVDANNDGKVDLWNEKADIYASAANFLNKLGWEKNEKWGREALIPKNFDYQLTGLNNKKTVNEWAALGVRRGNNSNLPKSNFKASLIVPMGHRGPAFLVYRNFDAIMGWNRSILYALSVAYLSDRLNGNAKLYAKTIDEPLLSKEDIMQIQNTLNLLGYDTGTPDGMAGSKTRKATRQFQSDIGLTADGYVGYELFQQLQ